MQIENLPKERQIQVQEMFSKLSRIENPYLFRKTALDEIVKILSIKGYSTILWMNRFYSKVRRKVERGRVYSYIHTNNPPKFLEILYDEYVKRSSSIIEEAIYNNFSNYDVGFVTMQELLDEEVVARDYLGFLRRLAGIGEMGYLWLQINEDDMWAFCLRKFTYEPNFTEEDVLVIKVIGERLLKMRRMWWEDNLVDIEKDLSERQLEIFDLYLQGLKRKDIAEKLDLNAETVKTHLEYAKSKVKDYSRLFVKIEDQLIFKDLKGLTPCQQRILKLLSEDMTRQMIADQLRMSKSAVNSQIDEIYKKMGTHSKRETVNKILLELSEK